MTRPAVLGRPNRGRRAQAGQGLTEFAFVLPIFVLVLVGLFDLGRAVFAYNTITNAAREGARVAIVNQDVPTIIERSKQQTQIVELSDPSVEVAFYQLPFTGLAHQTLAAILAGQSTELPAELTDRARQVDADERNRLAAQIAGLLPAVPEAAPALTALLTTILSPPADQRSIRS